MTETKTETPKADKKTKARRQTKGESLAEIQDLLAKIEAAEKAVEDAEIDWSNKREEAKTAKGVWMTRVSEMRELVRTRKRWAEEAKRQPLFNQAANGKPGENGQANGNGSASWRPRDVSHLGLSDKLADKLRGAGCGTLGELVDRMRAKKEFWFKDLKGIGAETAATIADALAAFRGKHPEYADL